MSGAAALRAMLASALTQALASASEIADGAGTPEHLHQCRIGLRRLRSALRDFAFLAGAAAPVEAPRWQEQLRELLAVLGRARDRDALAASLLPQLAAAGAPVASLPPLPGPVQDPAVLLRAPAANLLWLAILGWLQASALPPEPAAPALREQVRDRLAKLHRQVLADAVRYDRLDEAAPHRTRKRLKRCAMGWSSAPRCFRPPPSRATSMPCARRRTRWAPPMTWWWRASCSRRTRPRTRGRCSCSAGSRRSGRRRLPVQEGAGGDRGGAAAVARERLTPSPRGEGVGGNPPPEGEESEATLARRGGSQAAIEKNRSTRASSSPRAGAGAPAGHALAQVHVAPLGDGCHFIGHLGARRAAAARSLPCPSDSTPPRSAPPPWHGAARP